jgi:hypothetical protein
VGDSLANHRAAPPVFGVMLGREGKEVNRLEGGLPPRSGKLPPVQYSRLRPAACFTAAFTDSVADRSKQALGAV